jgi:hypothetical protein
MKTKEVEIMKDDLHQRIELTRNANTPSAVLEKLSDDSSDDVRCNVDNNLKIKGK